MFLVTERSCRWKNRDHEPEEGWFKFVERNYEDESNDNGNGLPDADVQNTSQATTEKKGQKQVESKLAPEVQNLMELMFHEKHFTLNLYHMNYNVNKLPLGKLTDETIRKGYEMLKVRSSNVGKTS